jgi:arginyl-tRNA synthetase
MRARKFTRNFSLSLITPTPTPTHTHTLSPWNVTQTIIAPQELLATAEAMGYGAVKYFDLNKNRTTDYKFDMQAMCALQGNTAVYLLYAHARICSIMRNAGIDMTAVRARAQVTLTHPSEQAFATFFCFLSLFLSLFFV